MANTKKASGTESATDVTPESYVQFPLVKINFILMAIAGLMIVVGFLLIAGGGSETGEFNPEVFSARRVVVGPTIAFLGFVFMGVGIMWNGKKSRTEFSSADTDHNNAAE